MAGTLTIGEVARRTGVPATTIRFYEAEGVLSAPARSESGYRHHTAADVRRLRLARRARLLGLSLEAVTSLVDQAFRSDCVEFSEQLLACISEQPAQIDRSIAELQALRGELDVLEAHVRHSQTDARPGQKVAECAYCPMIDEVGGDNHDSVSVPVREFAQVTAAAEIRSPGSGTRAEVGHLWRPSFL
jgi:MerR family copper efflux transcriptional regulator